MLASLQILRGGVDCAEGFESNAMSIDKRVGISLPAGSRAQNSFDLVRWAEANGFRDAWFSDSGAPDSLTLAAALHPYAGKMRIGCAVTPVYTRSPSVLAATAQVLGQLYPGRFVMGLGSSSETMMARFNGIPLEKPLTRVKETTIIVRHMLAGKKTAFNLETLSSNGYRQAPLDQPPPIYLAALRPKMIEMAAEIGDGVIFNLWPRKVLPRLLEHVKIGAARAGKRWQDIEIVNRRMALVTEDRQLAYDRFRASFAPYFANPVYNKFLAWAGYPDAAQEIQEGWAAKDRTRTTGAFSEALIEEIALIGSAEELRERVRGDAANGVHSHIISPLARDPEEARTTFEAFAGDRFSF